MSKPGTLYIVATPLGNLEDITLRALRILAEVDLIAAEDTRHSQRLLQHFQIKTPCLSLHQYNEQERAKQVIDKLHKGQSIALISDAGTPLISDPGFHLVQKARCLGLNIIPIPGACAAIAALSAAGLPTDRFFFEGFLPAKAVDRRRCLQQVVHEHRTLIYYETPHRIQKSLHDMLEIFGKDRQAVIAKELTKVYETIINGSLEDLVQYVDNHKQNIKGEFVILVHGAAEDSKVTEPEMLRILQLLMTQMSIKQAVALTSTICHKNKNLVYELALKQTVK